jgi:hypothetical protein
MKRLRKLNKKNKLSDNAKFDRLVKVFGTIAIVAGTMKLLE